MNKTTKILVSILVSAWLMLAFYFGWEPLMNFFSFGEYLKPWDDYLLFWLMGIALGGLWLNTRKEILFVILFPPLFLIGYGLFLKGIQWIFGYGEVHKTFRQVLSLFRSPGFILLFFGWKLLLNRKSRLF